MNDLDTRFELACGVTREAAERTRDHDGNALLACTTALREPLIEATGIGA